MNKISKDFQSTQLTQSSKASQEIRKRRKMEIFIDSANIQEIKKWLDYGIADEVTTNPSIFAGRVADEGHDAPELTKMAVGWLEETID